MVVPLSPVILGHGAPRREPPRPPALRDANYAEQFDDATLFYDVYRLGREIVFQGPPLLNLAEALLAAPLLRPRFARLLRRMRQIERLKSTDIRLRSDAAAVVLDGPLGSHEVAVQPNLSHRFAGRRVLHTLSKDNEPRWIVDWIRYYRAVHGADAVLFYDNASTRYTAADLEAELTATFPDMAITIVSWPFKYGPQGGLAGAVDGIEAPWDSDYCQAGSLQHARHRFLGSARSVLNVDIDELVVGPGSIFAAAESARAGFVKFPGQWVTTATPHPVTPATCRHGDFIHRDLAEADGCPPKWCLAPTRGDRERYSWSVHNLFGARANARVDPRFAFRHFKGISNSWKEPRWEAGAFDPARYVVDEPLAAALRLAELGPGEHGRECHGSCAT